jgi:hypothetical protein
MYLLHSWAIAGFREITLCWRTIDICQHAAFFSRCTGSPCKAMVTGSEGQVQSVHLEESVCIVSPSLLLLVSMPLTGGEMSLSSDTKSF